MDSILIPQYKEMKSGIALCVDRFYGYTNFLSYTLRIQSGSYNVSPKIQYLLNRIVTDNDIYKNGLYRFLSSCVLEFYKYSLDNVKNKKDLKIKEMKVDETMYKTFKTEIKAKVDKLEKMKKLHADTLKDLIAKQKHIWKVNENCDGQKVDSETKHDYIKNLDEEGKIRLGLKKMAVDIQNTLKKKIKDRLRESLEIIKSLISDFASVGRKNYLLAQINRIDPSTITKDIMGSFCKSYSFAVPSEYFRYLDFNQHLFKAAEINEANQLTTLMELEGDKELNVYMKQVNAKKNKPGIGQFFNFQNRKNKKQMKYLTSTLEKEDERKYTRLCFYC